MEGLVLISHFNSLLVRVAFEYWGMAAAGMSCVFGFKKCHNSSSYIFRIIRVTKTTNIIILVYYIIVYGRIWWYIIMNDSILRFRV